MKYVKTFENFSKEETTEDIKKLQDPNSPEFKALLTNLAKEKGVDPEEAVYQAKETAENSKKTGTLTEEIIPMVTLLIPVAVGGTLLLVGLLGAKLAARKGLKIYIEQEAERKVREMVKQNPELANNVEELVSKAYDEMMADKEFIDKVKSEQGHDRLVSLGSVRSGRGPY